MNVIETYPQLINYDPEVFEYFREQYVTILSQHVRLLLTVLHNLESIFVDSTSI